MVPRILETKLFAKEAFHDMPGFRTDLYREIVGQFYVF